MAKARYEVAVKRNDFGGKCEKGDVLGTYREERFARNDLQRLAARNGLGESQVGVFLNGRYLKPTKS